MKENNAKPPRYRLVVERINGKGKKEIYSVEFDRKSYANLRYNEIDFAIGGALAEDEAYVHER